MGEAGETGNGSKKELNDENVNEEKIELLQDKKERSEDLNNNASLKYQKLVKANDELKNKVLLYKGMVSLRDQELKLLKGKGRSPPSDDEDALEEIKIDD